MSLSDIFGLHNKVGFVTGAGSGLGAEIAVAAAIAGADVALADINTVGAEATAQRIRAIGRKALVFEVDVTREDQIDRAVQETIAQFDRIDILFNNAGIVEQPTLVHEMSGEQWRKVLGVNLDGMFYVAKAVLRVMVTQGNGKIINTASMWGLRGAGLKSMPIPAYTAAKGAVVNLTREMALEYVHYGITINALCPGFYRTNLADAYDHEEKLEALKAYTPMGRIADAAEIGGPAIFLASSASNFMTGQTLVVDGGCLA